MGWNKEAAIVNVKHLKLLNIETMSHYKDDILKENAQMNSETCLLIYCKACPTCKDNFIGQSKDATDW